MQHSSRMACTQKNAMNLKGGHLMSVERNQKNTRYKNQYNASNYDNLRIVAPKGRKATVEALAAKYGISVNGLVNRLLRTEAGLSEEEWKKGAEQQE